MSGLDQVDVLVSDVIMPGIGGPQLAQAFRQQWPELKVLFVSGYTENAIVHGGQLDAHVHFLAKPFDSQQLLAKVREVLAQGAQ
jgi:YesN/AraC family two-component response regulator